jgi:hypothetical protein
MSFLRNPITTGRRIIGCVVIVIGLILMIPSIAGFLIANGIYERSYIGGDQTTMTSPFNGQVFTFNINDKLKTGHNYDIVVKVNNIQGPDTMAQTGLLEMSLSVVGGTLSFTDSTSTGNFNETTAMSFNKWEITDNLVANVDLTFTLTIISLNNVTGGQIEIRIYQDPARFWVNLINTVSFWLIIPGVLVVCCGCCIAPPQRRSRYR